MVFEYLHSLGIAYRDLKPENLLVGADGYLKLVNFGLAKTLEGKTYTLCGTPEYLAPEVLLSKGHGLAADWWTLGIFIFEMIAGTVPFNADDPMIIYQKILGGRIKYPLGFNKFRIFRSAKDMVGSLLVQDLARMPVPARG